jgi:hypothetical protein
MSKWRYVIEKAGSELFLMLIDFGRHHFIAMFDILVDIWSMVEIKITSCNKIIS